MTYSRKNKRNRYHARKRTERTYRYIKEEHYA